MSTVSGDGAAAPETTHFAEAIARVRSVVGDRHVLVSREEIARRALDTLPAVRTPSAMVFPGSVEEVRAVVVIANEAKLPVWPCSRGKNWAYGAATPSVDGTVVLSLERLDRILEVNEELAYAVVEPGVTFAQLQQHLDQNQIRLWIDPTDSTPHGSVLGNALDRGIGVTPYGDHFGNLCGLEVVLADGRVIETGGGGPDSKILHTYKWGTGPYLDGLFSQSGFGVVTRAGVWLMPEPEAFSFYVLEVAREQDVASVIDECRGLVLGDGLRTRIHVMNDVARVVLVNRCSFDSKAERTYLSTEELAALRRRHGIPGWLLSGGLCSTGAGMRSAKRRFRRSLGHYGKLRFFDTPRIARVGTALSRIERARRLPGLSGPIELLCRRLFGKSLQMLEAVPHAYDRARGRPTEYFLRFAYYKARRPPPTADVDPARDGGGLIWFAPSLPFTGHHLTELLDLCRPLFAEYGFDFAVTVMPHNARSLVLVMGILYFKDNPAEVARAEALYHRLREVTSAAGYGQYRVSAPHQDLALAHAPAFRELADQIKWALDPSGIIAPGRYGLGLGADHGT